MEDNRFEADGEQPADDADKPPVTLFSVVFLTSGPHTVTMA